MIFRRVKAHVAKEDWFAVFIDFIIVVFGVYIGVWVSGFQERSSLRAKQVQVVETLRLDMQHVLTLDTAFSSEMNKGLAAWAERSAGGAIIPPYFHRIPGSDTPPQHVWSSLPPNQMTDMFAPDLLFDLGFYYSELDGVGRKYLRYIVFVEDKVLPGLKQDPSYFYRADGLRLKPEFEANMDRLQDWLNENARLRAWSSCLVKRLETPMVSGKPCIPDLSTSVLSNPDINLVPPKETP